MIITFNELRRIKDRLPSGSSQRIADELGLDVETVRNYFGGKHEAKECVGVHFEPGPDGGVVTLDDTTILDVAMRARRGTAASFSDCPSTAATERTASCAPCWDRGRYFPVYSLVPIAVSWGIT